LAEQQVHYAEFRPCQETRHLRCQGHAHLSALNNYRPSLRLYAILSTQPPTTIGQQLNIILGLHCKSRSFKQPFSPQPSSDD